MNKEEKKVAQPENDDSEDEEYVGKGLSEEEFNENLEFFKNHPLFMKEIPQDFEKNPHLKALQQMIYDDEPRTVADKMNKAGNDLLKRGTDKYFLKEAIKSYTEGIEQEFDDNELRSRLYSNRGFVNLKLKNYGKAIEDCRKAIELNPKFIKPYFRVATACMALEKYEDAEKVASEGLKIDPECQEIKNLLAEAQKKIKEIKEKKDQKKAETHEKYKTIVEHCKKNGYTIGKTRIHEIPDAYKRDPWVENGVLHFVTIITYLEFGQMDIIQTSKETDILEDHLKEIFKERLPWDEHHYYKYDDLAAFVELNSVDPLFKTNYHTNYERGYYRVQRKKPLSEILKINGYVMPFVLEIYILSKKSPFYEKFLSECDIIKRK